MRALVDRFAALPRFRRWAAAATIGWAVLVVGYGAGFLAVAAGGQGRGTLFLDAMFFLVALAVPLVLVWLAAWLAEELAQQRELLAALAGATAPLIDALAATRESLDRQAPATPETIRRALEDALARARAPDATPHLDRLQAGQARLEVAVQRLAAARAALAPDPVPAIEPAAAPAPAEPAEAPPAEATDGLEWPELVRALDFPRDADDREGFRALKSALRHRGLAQVLQAAEDVLNLLSQEGVFVDDLPMQPVDVTAWRRFMAGVRGAEVAGLGGINEQRALAAARGLMQSDSIFRDSALFFQRRFDRLLAEAGKGASDAELRELAATRSGRAFMLLVRLSGSLDG
jgi:hypothetical protein